MCGVRGSPCAAKSGREPIKRARLQGSVGLRERFRVRGSCQPRIPDVQPPVQIVATSRSPTDER
jgi:hypothetical protein